MNPSRPFILRPVATSLLMLAIVLAGLVGLRLLPLAALPQVDYPTIQVQTLYPGASPEVMAQTVTAPLERQFGQMAGLSRLSSTSAAGVSIVTLQFGLGLALDVAEQQVQAAINAGASLLPADPIFEISILYGSFSIYKEENLNSEIADLATDILVFQPQAVL